ncbi:hypothetical protein RJZ56_003588 [Blastomyces dermatitidis]
MVLPLTYSVSSCQFWAIDSHGIWIPSGAICIALPILFSWVATAFDNVWLLVGKTAPREFVDKCIYVGSTHDWRIQEVDTRWTLLRTKTPLKVSHDVNQSLQRKLGGLASVERAFDHADHEDTHNPMRSTNRYILPLGRRGEPFERG